MQEYVVFARAVRSRETEIGAARLREYDRARMRAQSLREVAELSPPGQIHHRLVTQRRADEARLQSLFDGLEEEVILRQASRLVEYQRESRELEVSERAVSGTGLTPPPLPPRDGWGEVLRFPDMACCSRLEVCRCGRDHTLWSSFDTLLGYLRCTTTSLDMCMHLITCPEVSVM